MGIIGCAFFPHPPLVVPEVGQGQEAGAAATLQGMEELAGLVAERRPEVIAVITPHGPAFSDVIAISGEGSLSGSLRQFHAPQVALGKEVNLGLAHATAAKAAKTNVPVAVLDGGVLKRLRLKPELDHGALVPLYFVEKQYADYTLLHISPGSLPVRKQFLAGQALRAAAEALGLRVLVLASGDMSHRLKQDGPYGFDAAGPQFDALVTGAIERGEPGGILAIDPALARQAGECGWRSWAMALGALEGSAVDCRLLSYEGPFGVGYMTALLQPAETGETSRIACLDRAEAVRAEALRREEDAFVRLARAAVEHYVRTQENPQWSALKNTVSEIERARIERRKAGAFVSLHLDGELRGCMGTIVPTCPHVGEEILRNAMTACSEDPRFPPVEEDELPGLEVKVDILSPFEPVGAIAALDPQRYGVIVEKSGRRGLLLPRLDGVTTVRQQLEIACQKAGFSWRENDGIKLFRFTVERHGGEE